MDFEVQHDEDEDELASVKIVLVLCVVCQAAHTHTKIIASVELLVAAAAQISHTTRDSCHTISGPLSRV